MDSLQQRLWTRANSYQWDSKTFYTSDADMMREACGRIERLEGALRWIMNNTHDKSAHHIVSRDALA